MSDCRRALILAAGRGSRMNNLTDDKPKCFNQVGGKSLLAWQMDAIKGGGIEDIHVVTGYKAGMFNSIGLKCINNPDWETTNMVSSLLCARALFSEPLLVSYSDILYNHEIVRALRESSHGAVISYDTAWRKLWNQRFDDPLDDAESFRVEEDGKIVEIGRRVNDIETINGQYMGLMKFDEIALSNIVVWAASHGETVRKTDMTTMLQGLITEGYPVHGLAIKGNWCEVDSEKDLLLAEELLKTNKLSLGSK